ncbi:MAG: class I SAM-dependent methyltransferase [Bryobacteraceae bacterium]
MPSVYTFKPSPYSSHSLLLQSLPESGLGKSVLDVGCGNGYLSAILASRGYQVTGIERAEGHSGEFPRDVKLIEADLEQGLPKLEKSFDYALCADILEHLRTPSRLLQQLRGVLTEGGILIASLPNSGNIWFRANILCGRFPQDDKGLFDRTHVRFYMWKGWQELFHVSGFRVCEVRSSAIPVGLVMPKTLQESSPVRLAESVCYGLARMHRTLFAYQFIVRAAATEQK